MQNITELVWACSTSVHQYITGVFLQFVLEFERVSVFVEGYALSLSSLFCLPFFLLRERINARVKVQKYF